MAGKESKDGWSMGRLGILLPVIAIQVAFFLDGCASHKIVSPKSYPPHEKKTEGQGVYHQVERHQTLYRICKTYKVDLKEVASLNSIADPDKIRAGRRIFIPGATKILKVEVYLDDVVAEPGRREQEKIFHERPNFLWPVEGRLGDVFEEAENRRHQGIDIISPPGTPIKAVSSGFVLYSGNGISGYGNLVILRHSEEFVSVYAHNQVNLVEEGGWIEKGQFIGKVGQTGRATGPHLHFEIRRDNKAVDPLLFLR